jgi:hypothetical protein
LKLSTLTGTTANGSAENTGLVTATLTIWDITQAALRGPWAALGICGSSRIEAMPLQVSVCYRHPARPEAPGRREVSER